MAKEEYYVDPATGRRTGFKSKEEYDAFIKKERDMQKRHAESEQQLKPVADITGTAKTYTVKDQDTGREIYKTKDTSKELAAVPAEEGTHLGQMPGRKPSLSEQKAELMTQAPSRASLDSAINKLNEKRKYFRPTKKGTPTEVEETEAEENIPEARIDTTLPLLHSFIRDKKGPAFGVAGSDTFVPSLIKGIKALNKENPGDSKGLAYKALAMQIKEDLEDKQKTVELNKIEKLFMNMAANSDIDDVRKEVKELRVKYNIDKKAFDSMISEWERQHRDYTLNVYRGPNEIGISVSGEGGNRAYILKVVEQDGEKWLKGYEALDRGTDTNDWLKDHVAGGTDKLDSIGQGYPANTPEEFNEAFEHWLDAAIGNQKQLKSGRNGKYDRQNKAKDLMYAKELDGKNAVEVFKARVEDLAKNGALKYPDFQNMLSKWHALGVEIDRDTYDMYLPENVPEGFKPIKFMTKEQKDAARYERINEQAKSIFEKAKAGNKGYSLDEEGYAVRTRESRKKSTPDMSKMTKAEREKAEKRKRSGRKRKRSGRKRKRSGRPRDRRKMPRNRRLWKRGR